jgi:putative ATP-binding cassette transporter
MVSPAYFAGAVQLGGLMQTANAFGQVQDALSVFVNIYRSLAEWRAVIERLAGFDHSITAAREAATTPPVITLAPGEAPAVSISDLVVRLPQGTPLVSASKVSIKLGEQVLVSGPSGSGKSTLFRALAGVWPFGSGTITVPKNARVMILPQRPYFPIAPLAAAVAYPAGRESYDEGKIAGTDQRRRPACTRRPNRRRSALEQNVVARRATTVRHRPRASIRAGLPLPRRGHRIAR